MKHNISAFVLVSMVSMASIATAQEWVYFNTTNSGIPSNYVRHVAIDHEGALWMGTQNAGLAKYANDTWTVFNVSNSDMTSDNIEKVVVDHENAIWMTAYGGELTTHLMKYHNADWQVWTNLFNNQTAPIDDIDIDPAGYVWLPSGYSSALIKFDGSTFTTYNHMNSCLPTLSFPGLLPYVVRAISSTSRWVGFLYNGPNINYPGGSVLMNGNTCSFFDKNNSDYPASGQILLIHPDPLQADVVWFVTNRGIVSFDGTSWVPLPAHPGGSPTGNIVIDQTGRLWSTNIAIGLCYYKNNAWTIYSGPPDYFINELLLDSDNKLWAATTSKGLAYIDLDDVVSSVETSHSYTRFDIYPTISNGEVIVEHTTRSNDHEDHDLVVMNTIGQTLLTERIHSSINRISLTEFVRDENLLFYFIKDDNGRIVQTGKLILSAD